MTSEGPPLEPLLRRTAECPVDLAPEASRHPSHAAEVVALVHDVLETAVSRAPDAAELVPLEKVLARSEAQRRLVSVAAWVLADRSFVGRVASVPHVLDYLTHELATRAETLRAEAAVAEDDRREELVRSLLEALGLRPLGETQAQAADRLAALDGRARKSILARARDRLRRAREVRDAMRRRADEDAAARMTGE